MIGAIARGIGGAIVGEVAVALALKTGSFDKGIKDSVKMAEKEYDKAFNGIGSAGSQMFGKLAKTIGSAFAVKQVWDFGKASVSAASQSQSAWTGLYSIVDGTGKSFAEAKGFIEEYISDGLVPLENATTSYKNLASRGYSTEQIENVMTRLKDAAAFGRQASYSLGDAITSATEGLKNENSILVDNAGVTKNVAKMWDEYAASIGTTANNLTQEQKIQAEVNGIMAETTFQVGDAAAYTNTFAGRTAQLSTAFLNLKTAVGKVIGPIASAFIPVITTAMNVITRFMNKVQQLLSVFGFKWQEVITKNSSGIAEIGDSAGITADKVGAIGDSATKTAKQLKRALGGMDELNILNTSAATGSAGGKGASGTGGASGLGASGVTGMFDNTITEDPISPQIQKIADNIKRYLEPLKSINLDNLASAFGRLKEAIQPITKKLLEGLDWLWFNILVPVATWTVEEAIPSFLDAISGALNFFNGVMDVAKPHLAWLWDEFLQPIASWTGGVIVDVLGWIGEKLSGIGDWLSQNSDVIYEKLQPIRTILTGFKDILSITWNFITTVIAPAITPILDGIGNTFGIIFGTMSEVLMGMWRSIGGFLDFIVGVFTGDWERAWQGIKDIFGGVLDRITAYFGGVVDWFDNKVDTLLGFFKGLWTGVQNLFSGVGTWFTNHVLNPISNAFTNAFNGIKNTISNIWDGILGFFSKGGKIFDGVVDGISGVFKTIVNGLIGGINKVISTPFNKINSLLNTIRNLSFLGVSPFKGLWSRNPLPVPQIPKLAQGGWVAANNPQLAIIGDNKREGEIVTPESKIYEQTLKAIKDAGGSGKQQIEITIYHKYEDGRTVIQKINQAQIDAGEVLLLT